MDMIKTLLEEVKEEIGLKDDIKIKLVPMQQKVASTSLDKKVLRLNSNIIEKLDESELKYVLLHELIHLKVKDVNHGSLFLQELGKYVNLENTWEIEVGMIKKLTPKRTF